MSFERLFDFRRALVQSPAYGLSAMMVMREKGNIKVNYEDLSFPEQDQGQAKPPKIGRLSID